MPSNKGSTIDVIKLAPILSNKFTGENFLDFKSRATDLFVMAKVEKIVDGTNTPVLAPTIDRLDPVREHYLNNLDPRDRRKLATEDELNALNTWDYYDIYRARVNDAWFLLSSIIDDKSEAYSLVREQSATTNKDPAKLWKALEAKYERTTASNQLRQSVALMNMKPEPEECLVSFIARLKVQRSMTEASGAPVTDAQMCTYLLSKIGQEAKWERLYDTLLSDKAVATTGENSSFSTLVTKIEEYVNDRRDLSFGGGDSANLKSGTSDTASGDKAKALSARSGGQQRGRGNNASWRDKNYKGRTSFPNRFNKHHQKRDTGDDGSSRGSGRRGGDHQQGGNKFNSDRNKHPCGKCGFYSHTTDKCRSKPETIKNYQRKKQRNSQLQGVRWGGQKKGKHATDGDDDSDGDSSVSRSYVTRVFHTKSIDKTQFLDYIFADSAAERNILTSEFVEHHYRGIKDLDEDVSSSPAVQFGSGPALTPVATGSFGLMTDSLILDDPSVHPSTNLLSLPQLDTAGYKMVVAGGRISYFHPDVPITAEGKAFMRSQLVDGLYRTSASDVLNAARSLPATPSTTKKSSTSQALKSSSMDPELTFTYTICNSASDDDRRLSLALPCKAKTITNRLRQTGLQWHRALGHVSAQRIIKTAKHSSAEGLTPRDVTALRRLTRGHENQCLHCGLGNFPQLPVNKVSENPKTYSVGESWHIDAVPFGVKSIGGNTMAFLANDEYSSYSIDDYAPGKDVRQHVIPYLERFIGEVETAGHKVKFIHFDADSIFEDDIVQDYLRDKRIEFGYSEPGEHRHSGSIERMVYTIRSIMRKSMKAAHVPDQFWPYAFGNAVYINNRLLTTRFRKDKIREFMTPFEIFKGKKPDLRKIGMFGAAVVSRIPNPRSHLILDDRGRLGVLLGNSETHNDAFVIYSLRTKRIIISKDVVIDENRLGFTGSPADWFSGATAPSGPFSTDLTADQEATLATATLRPVAQPSNQSANPSKRRGRPPKHRNALVDTEPRVEGILKTSSSSSRRKRSTNDVTFDVTLSTDPQVETSQSPVVSRHPLDTSTGRSRGQTPQPPAASPLQNVRRTTRAVSKQTPVSGRNVAFSVTLLNKRSCTLSEEGYGKKRAKREFQLPDSTLLSALETFSKMSTAPAASHSNGQTFAHSSHARRCEDPILQQRRLELKALRARAPCPLSSRQKSLERIPRTYEEAMSPEFRDKYEPAIKAELDSLVSNKTFGEATALPDGTSPLGLRWIFDVKRDTDGNVIRYKARLVAKGYTQVYGDSYTDTYAPTPGRESLRMLLSLAAKYRLKTFQGDVTTAFLNGRMDEKVYVNSIAGLPDIPNGYGIPLLKALYGTKQAARQWYKILTETMLSLGYTACYPEDQCVYIKHTRPGKFVLICCYVDDIFGVGNDHTEIEKFNREFGKIFKYKDMGEIKSMLGMKVERLPDGSIKVSNERAILDMLRDFKLDACAPRSTPAESHTKLSAASCPFAGGNVSRDLADMQKDYRKLVGSQMYLATTVRPDIAAAVQDLGKFLHNPGMDHWRAAIRVLYYLKGTSALGMTYHALPEGTPIRPRLQAFSDADWAGSKDDRISTSGLIIRLIDESEDKNDVSSHGDIIFYQSKKQDCITMSTSEAEFVAACTCALRVIPLRRLLGRLGFDQSDRPTTMFEDNTACIAIANEEGISQRTKHIDIKYLKLKELVKGGVIRLVHLSTKKMTADILTKNLAKPTFMTHRVGLGMI